VPFFVDRGATGVQHQRAVLVEPVDVVAVQLDIGLLVVRRKAREQIAWLGRFRGSG